MANVIRTEAELQRRHGVGQHADSCDGCLMADTIRSLWADLADADNTAVLQSKAILDGEAERDRMKAVYDAAVKWRELDSAHTRGTLLAAVTAVEGK